MESYYDPRHGLGSSYKFYKSQNRYTYQQVKDMIAKQEAYQLNKQGRNVYFPIWGHGDGSYQMDLMFPPEVRGYTCILCIININTRYAYCYALKSKAGTYEALKRFFSDVKDVHFMQSDRGSEFNNAKVKALLEKHDVEFDMVNTADHAGQGKVERFNETLRRLITVYCSAYKTRDWVSVLDDLVYNYNHRFHRVLGVAPANATEQTGLSKALEQYYAAKEQFDAFKIGSKVRVLTTKDLFDKGRKEWSNDVYKIDDIEGHKIHVAEMGWMKPYEVQLVAAVHKRLFDDNKAIDTKAIKKEKKVKRDLRKEGVDASNIVEKRVKSIKFDKSLAGKRIDRGGGETGTITKYDEDGDFKWFVKYDKAAKMKSEWMDASEVKQFLIK